MIHWNLVFGNTRFM